MCTALADADAELAHLHAGVEAHQTSQATSSPVALQATVTQRERCASRDVPMSPIREAVADEDEAGAASRLHGELTERRRELEGARTALDAFREELSESVAQNESLAVQLVYAKRHARAMEEDAQAARAELSRVEQQLLRREGQPATARDAGRRTRGSDEHAASPGAPFERGLDGYMTVPWGLDEGDTDGLSPLPAGTRPSSGARGRFPGTLPSRQTDGPEVASRWRSRWSDAEAREVAPTPREGLPRPTRLPPTPHPREALWSDGDDRWGGGGGERRRERSRDRSKEEEELRAQLTTMQVGRSVHPPRTASLRPTVSTYSPHPRFTFTTAHNCHSQRQLKSLKRKMASRRARQSDRGDEAEDDETDETDETDEAGDDSDGGGWTGRGTGWGDGGGGGLPSPRDIWEEAVGLAGEVSHTVSRHAEHVAGRVGETVGGPEKWSKALILSSQEVLPKSWSHALTERAETARELKERWGCLAPRKPEAKSAREMRPRTGTPPTVS